MIAKEESCGEGLPRRMKASLTADRKMSAVMIAV